MVKRIGGMRRKSRYKFKRDRRQKGKLSLRKYLEEYKAGDKVVLDPDSIVQKGIFEHKWIGRSGIVSKKLGNCYEVIIYEKGNEKKLIIHPIHLKRC